MQRKIYIDEYTFEFIKVIGKNDINKVSYQMAITFNTSPSTNRHRRIKDTIPHYISPHYPMCHVFLVALASATIISVLLKQYIMLITVVRDYNPYLLIVFQDNPTKGRNIKILVIANGFACVFVE